ncbi:MAG: helix-turn-helix domain-containing protein [Candidatus Bathyarchaeia archaeon]
MSDKPNREAEFSTSELASMLSVSIRTIYRWIEAGQIRYLRTGTGRYRFAESELKRIQAERKSRNLDRINEEIIRTVRGTKIVYLRELQVRLEDFFWHEDVTDACESLVDSKLLNTKSYEDNRWYFPVNVAWDEVKSVAENKKRLMDIYINHPRKYERRGVIYDDYSEMLVEDALIKAGYVVVSKNAHYFNGKEYHQSGEEKPGRKKDVDYIAYAKAKDLYIGIQIKNRLECPRVDDAHQLVDICRILDLTPVFVTRLSHPRIYEIVRTAKGDVIQMKRYLLQPEFPRESFKEITELLRIPLGVYQWVPDFLIRAFEELKQKL